MIRKLFVSLMISLGIIQTVLGDTQAKTLVHGGRTRSYRVHLPPSYREGSPMALVFALHGYGNTAAKFEKTTGFNRIADHEGFIVVYPNAVAFGPKRKQMWNGGGIYEMWSRGLDDVGFISVLIDELSRVYAIDPARIYAFGHSNGGFMAYNLGARLPNRFAAIACHSGLSVRRGFVAGPPVSVIHFHGKRDLKAPYSGIPKHGWAGVEKGISLWVKRNRCLSKAEIVRQDNRIRIRKWANPRCSGDVVLVELKDWGHGLARTDQGAPITAAEEAWKFFKSHPKIDVTLRSSGKIEGGK